jgi:hypothetical protein
LFPSFAKVQPVATAAPARRIVAGNKRSICSGQFDSTTPKILYWCPFEVFQADMTTI